MNKITPHLIRDLNATLPEGTECYLCSAVRQALSKYRRGREPATYLAKEQAVPMLSTRLGRGLKRFFVKDVQAALDSMDNQKNHLSWPF
ncbi:hypothetical protein PL263_08255 [Methylomonas sp. EFPC3]|uniref:hypothetical protein n=1 Tax=unclassified Methylomonas TaxID=2608980 RepID=UPI002415BD1C|nr:hypothetical protein [Methylomonas sp. EFPC3]WFP52013.1 hypothetical protein PL263_08255 [Methylomonas sp. EFPC3]